MERRRRRLKEAHRLAQLVSHVLGPGVSARRVRERLLRLRPKTVGVVR